ncbi:MAG TPA: hypothetical protein VE818_05010 [Nitrososphaeraceae archaeon]|nr:hypothetical protein [Nitrososphaeraceae archaeon]
MLNDSEDYIIAIYVVAFITSFVITSIIIVIRIRKVLQGTKISIRKSILFSAYYIVITSFLIYNSFLLAVPVTYAIPYALAALLSTYISYVYSKRSLLFWKQDSINVYVKGGIALYLLYVIALSIRIAINFIFIGYQEVTLNQQGDMIIINRPIINTTSELTTLSLIVTDFLLVLGVGLLLGRNLRVIKYYSRQIRNQNSKK